VNSIPRATTNEGITCQACHDPHEVGMGDAQLRYLPTATLSNGYVVTEGGLGTLCMNCHHGRQSAEVGVLGTPNPHYGVQGDMLAGQNAITYGIDMPSSRHLQAVSNSCVGCHMQLIPGTVYSNYNTLVGGHTFRLSWDAGTPDPSDDIKVTEVCSVCHVEANTFDFGGEDYDRDGTIEGVQTEIRGLLESVSLLLPPLGSTTVTVTGAYTPAQKKGAYNYLFVKNDNSYGVHNPKFAAAILWASIQDLSGGIDFDNDGLLDAWEMLWFGSLTAQNGSGDADNDGVSNALGATARHESERCRHRLTASPTWPSCRVAASRRTTSRSWTPIRSCRCCPQWNWAMCPARWASRSGSKSSTPWATARGPTSARTSCRRTSSSTS
jgi:hypothetical protein